MGVQAEKGGKSKLQSPQKLNDIPRWLSSVLLEAPTFEQNHSKAIVGDRQPHREEGGGRREEEAVEEEEEQEQEEAEDMEQNKKEE